MNRRHVKIRLKYLIAVSQVVQLIQSVGVYKSVYQKDVMMAN